MTTDDLLTSKLRVLHAQLRDLGSVLVAFSGGADSAFLLAAAARVLGTDRVVAATAVSPSLPDSELDSARAFARTIGVAHHLPPTQEMSRPGYVANGRDRCFHCKAELLSVLTPLAQTLGLDAVLTGTNADDVVDRFRPGIRAAAAAGAKTPLADADFTKAEVRAASRLWDLPTADKPAAACLSSRVAYGIPITPVTLGRIERAERDLRQAMTRSGLAVQNLRVRDLGDHARIEVDPEIVTTLLVRPDLLGAVSGFPRVEIDPRGFRSGSMNEVA